jgi:hypothetical protein
MVRRLALPLLLGMLVVPAGPARGDDWPTAPISAPDGNPTDFGSPRLDPSEGMSLEAGRWDARLTATEWNAWRGSWHTATYHRLLGREGLPISDEEIALIERENPQGTAYRIDLEGWRSDLSLAYGLPGGFVAGLRLPVHDVGHPHWDVVAEAVHLALGFTTDARDVFPRGQTLVWIRGKDGARVLAREELNGSGIGDTTLWLGMPAGNLLGGTQRLSVVLDAPTGEKGSLRGSGGWDAGVRAFSAWQGERFAFQAAAGWSWLDPAGSWLGIRRSNLWHLLAEGRWRAGRKVALFLQARLDSAPLAGVVDGNLADPSLVYHLGIVGEIAPETDLAFQWGQDVPEVGVGADWTFHLSIGRRF